MMCVSEQNDKGKYCITLWSMRTGDCCGMAVLTEEEIKDWLSHYGVAI